MKLFYKRIRVDAETLRFYAECPICGKKQYGARIPLICRSVRTLARCANGRANKLSQSAFNHAKVKATQQLALRFNQCRHCFQCVCDDCYDSTDTFGACRDCFKKMKDDAPPQTMKNLSIEKEDAANGRAKELPVIGKFKFLK